MLQVLPMKTLQSLHCGKSTPVDCVDMPDGNRTHDTADAIAKKTNGNDTKNDGSCAQRQVVEEILCRENSYTGGSVGGRGGCDGADCVFLQVPRTRIDKSNDRDITREFAVAVLLPPSSLKLVTAGKCGGPCLTEKVGDKNDESSGNDNLGGFELDRMLDG